PQKVPVPGGAVQLAPGSAAGMPVGTEIAPAHPAPIGAVWIRAEMARGVDLTAASPCGDEARWRGTGCWGTGLNSLCTGVAVGLMGESGKGCRPSGALWGWWRGWLGWTLTLCGPIAWPGVVEHETQPE